MTQNPKATTPSEPAKAEVAPAKQPPSRFADVVGKSVEWYAYPGERRTALIAQCNEHGVANLAILESWGVWTSKTSVPYDAKAERPNVWKFIIE